MSELSFRSQFAKPLVMLIFRQKYFRLLPLLPFICAFLVYFQTVDFGYVWDDRDILLKSAGLRSWDSIWSHMGKAFFSQQIYFRPLALLSLGAEQILSGGSAFVAHLDSVLVFSVNASLVAILGALIAEDRKMKSISAWISGASAGLLYAVHPALIEMVCWISCRFDLLLSFFCLLMLLADRLLMGKKSRTAAVTFLWLLAAFSKETALGLALALPFWHLMFIKPATPVRNLVAEFRRERHFHLYGAIFVAGLVYLYLRQMCNPVFYLAPTLNYTIYSTDHFLCIFKSIGSYVRFVAWPFLGIGPVHTLSVPLSIFDPLVILGQAYSVAGVALLVYSLKGGRSAVGFLLSFSAALMPMINLIPLQIGGSYIAERYLSFPLIFVAVAIPLLIREIWLASFSGQLKKICTILFLGTWSLMAAFNLQAGIPFWKNDISLWTLGYMREPDNHMVLSNLQSAYVNAGMYGEAKQLAEQVVWPRNKALTLEQAKNYMWTLTGLDESRTEQVSYLAKMVDHVSNDSADLAPHLSECAFLLMLDGQIEQAEPLLQRALRISSFSPDSNYRMAILRMAQNRSDLAQPYLQQWRRSVHPSELVDREANIPGLVKRIRNLHDQGGSTVMNKGASDMPLEMKNALRSRAIGMPDVQSP